MQQDREREEQQDNASGRPGGGAGRSDEVGGSGVYPASGPDAPDDAEVRTPGEWGEGAGGNHDSSRSEPTPPTGS